MTKNTPKKKEFYQYLLLVMPGFIIFTIGVIIPMFMSFRYSMTSWNGLTAEMPWNGIANYQKMFQDEYVKSAWWFTIKFTFWNVLIQNVFALLFAVILDSGIRCKKIYRTILFIPCLISSVVAGFIWLRMFSNILPAVTEFLSINLNLKLFGDQKTVLSGLLIANNWQWIGYWMLIYLAGLQSVPSDLYEAAKIDGAKWSQRFRNVTVPMLAPSFTICIIGITTGSLKVYDLMVSSTAGGPGRASTSIIYLIYDTAIGGRQYGYGSALSISLIFALLLVAAFQVKVLKKKEVQA
ncbi:MAG: sugar ABC transporter permease [Lachnospiraceae bacterium]|nr:sugar ABC transporter permease [Lachnospiraceae bacterium]